MINACSPGGAQDGCQDTMASSSTAATSNVSDASNTVDEDEVALVNRLFLVEEDIEWNRLSQDLKFAVIPKTPGRVIEAAKKYAAVQKGILGRLMCPFFSSCLVLDRKRNWESRFLKLFWRHSDGISDSDLLLFFNKLAEHYLPSHKVENLEEFLLTDEERATFLNDCSTFDKATRLAKDFNEFSLRQTQGQKPHYWTRRDHTLHSVSSSESAKPLEVIFPFSTRFETAKECLARLDLLKSVAVDLNPDESDTVTSVLSSLKLPELQALHALQKEMELHGEVALQLEQLSGKHLLAYEELSKDQLEIPDEFFRTCQEEKRTLVEEALYEKVKCLASIERAAISRQVKLSSEDLLKWIVQKAGSAFKEVEGKLKKAQSSENVDDKECTLCHLEFSKKRKRACLDPCGHASVCIDCATKSWTMKPNCPWCKASIRRLISIPAQIYP